MFILSGDLDLKSCVLIVYYQEQVRTSYYAMRASSMHQPNSPRSSVTGTDLVIVIQTDKSLSCLFY